MTHPLQLPAWNDLTNEQRSEMRDVAAYWLDPDSTCNAGNLAGAIYNSARTKVRCPLPPLIARFHIPEQPTEAMVSAVFDAVRCDDREVRAERAGWFWIAYRAMLSATPAAPVGEWPDATGAAERDVGRYLYQRLEALMDANSTSPELAWIARVIESVEEYGVEHCKGDELASFPVPESGGSLQKMQIAPEARDRVQLNADGSLDEVVFTGLAHLEQMDDGTWWLGLSRPDGSGYHVWLHAKKRGLLVATHHEEPSARKGVVGDE